MLGNGPSSSRLICLSWNAGAVSYRLRARFSLRRSACRRLPALSGALDARLGIVARFVCSLPMGVGAKAADRSRPPEQIALHLVTHLFLQELQFRAGLDAFS